MVKDLTKEEIEAGRPGYSALFCIDYALKALYEDDNHRFTDVIVRNLSFEELFGALLMARDEIIELQKENDELLNLGGCGS